MFEIEKNVPFPHKKHSRYPWKQMEIDDSFLVPCTPQDLKKIFSSLSSCKRHASRVTGWKFVTRSSIHGIRVWRVKPTARLTIEHGVEIPAIKRPVIKQPAIERFSSEHEANKRIMAQVEKCERLRQRMTWRTA